MTVAKLKARSEASRQKLNSKYFDAQLFLAKIKRTINWSLYPQGLRKIHYFSINTEKRDHPDFIRWMLNLVVPLLTLFGVLNLVVSSEAIEGFFNFFQDSRPGTSRNYVGSDGIIMHGKAAPPKEEPIDPSKLQPVVQELYNAQNQQNGNQNFNQPNSYQQELQQQQLQFQQQVNSPQNGRMPIGSGNAANILDSMTERNLLDPSPIKMSQFREIGADPENDLEETNVNQDNDFRPGLDFNNMQFPDSSKIHVNECPNLDGHDWSEEITPKYSSHPWRFLMPVLYYGPNNQIHGLRESIILAIKPEL